MNPELIRNLRLELTWARALIPLLLFGLVEVIDSSRDRAPFWAMGAILLFGLWGLRAQSDAVTSEVQGRTWDDQRLSGLSAWSLVWGKFIGVAAPAWIGIIVALTVGLISVGRLPPDDVRGAFRALTGAAACAFLGQAVALFASCAFVRLRWGARASMVAFGLGLFSWLFALDVDAHVIGHLADLPLSGWAVQIAWMFGAGLFALWGAERCVRGELRLTCRPLLFPLFLIYSAALFQVVGSESGDRAYAGGVAALVVCWAAMMFAPKNPIDVLRWRRDARAGRGLADPPLWLTAFVCAVLVTVIVLLSSAGASSSGAGGLALMLVLSIRDAAVVHACALWMRRGHAFGVVCVLALYGFMTLTGGDRFSIFTLLAPNGTKSEDLFMLFWFVVAPLAALGLASWGWSKRLRETR